MMKLYLGICNLWIGVMFFIVLGRNLPALRFPQAGLFLIIGTLYLIEVFRKKTDFSFPANNNKKIITLILLVVVFCYPIFGLMRGHNYTQLVYMGTLPCATTAFALVLIGRIIAKSK